jgi:hypothetical protein
MIGASGPIYRKARASSPPTEYSMTVRSRMSESEWVGFLYRMRGYELPPEVFADTEAAI